MSTTRDHLHQNWCDPCSSAISLASHAPCFVLVAAAQIGKLPPRLRKHNLAQISPSCTRALSSRPSTSWSASARRSACTTAIVAFPRMRTFDKQGKSLCGTTERRRTRALQDLRQTATFLAPLAQRSSSIAIATSPRMGPSSDLRTRGRSIRGYSCAAELPRSPLSPPVSTEIVHLPSADILLREATRVARAALRSAAKRRRPHVPLSRSRRPRCLVQDARCRRYSSRLRCRAAAELSGSSGTWRSLGGDGDDDLWLCRHSGT